nr:YwdI family protein [Lysinibacillus timonensis]
MISFQTLLEEMEKHIRYAKEAKSNQQAREHLIAIRALCDVGLVEQNSNNTVTTANLEENISLQPVQLKNTTLSSSNKIREDGANGDSIFDF